MTVAAPRATATASATRVLLLAKEERMFMLWLREVADVLKS
jgi:hypothetical protein